LTATTVSSISDLNLAGLVTVQSATSFAKAVSTGGDPVLSGGAIFQNIKVAGQPAYVDGNGVHLGTPGKPAPSSLLTMVDKVLIQAGLQIYSTAPETVKIGGVSYYYGASLLIYFPVPHDPNGDTLTVAIGGAAIKMEATPGFTTPTSAPTMPPSLTSPGVSGGSGGSGSGLSTSTSPGPVIPPSPAPLRLSLPTTGTPAIPGALGALRPAVSTPHGIPAWWLLLLAGALLLGAFGLTRVPALLAAAAAPACDTPTTRSP
jgi:hypothetical protein